MNDDLVNVGERFRFCFKLLLILHLFQMVCVVLIRIVRPLFARWIHSVVPPILLPVLLIVNLMLFYSRFVHSGRVCSGDYLDSKAESPKGYLLAQGALIKTYAMILSVGIYLFWCCICFISAKKTAANNKKREEQARAAMQKGNNL